MLSLNLLYFIITRCNISRASIFLEISKEILNDYLSLLIGSTILTHWGRLTDIYVGNLTIICSDNSLSPGRWTRYSKPLSESLLDYSQFDLCEHISKKFETKYTNFIDKNAFENAVWKMAAILSWLQCVNWSPAVAPSLRGNAGVQRSQAWVGVAAGLRSVRWTNCISCTHILRNMHIVFIFIQIS